MMVKRQSEDPMTEVPDFERSHEDACAEEGHVMHDGYCLRCPYIEKVADGNS